MEKGIIFAKKLLVKKRGVFLNFYFRQELITKKRMDESIFYAFFRFAQTKARIPESAKRGRSGVPVPAFEATA